MEPASNAVAVSATIERIVFVIARLLKISMPERRGARLLIGLSYILKPRQRERVAGILLEIDREQRCVSKLRGSIPIFKMRTSHSELRRHRESCAARYHPVHRLRRSRGESSFRAMTTVVRY